MGTTEMIGPDRSAREGLQLRAGKSSPKVLTLADSSTLTKKILRQVSKMKHLQVIYAKQFVNKNCCATPKYQNVWRVQRRIVRFSRASWALIER
jgi:hypothetical protein